MPAAESDDAVHVHDEDPGTVPRPAVLLALKDSLAVAVAAAAMGLAFGVLVSQSGLHWWWATIFSAVIFAGSLEFLLLGLVMTLAPLGQIAATAFVVNVRHVFYALSFPLHRVHGVAAKAYSTFALTDEAFALAARPDARNWSRARIVWVQAFVQVFWVGSVTVGALCGTLIPAGLAGLDFAVTALFVVLGIDAFRARHDVPAAIVAVACALTARLMFGDQMVLAAMGMFTAFLVVRYVIAGKVGRRA
jgi:4-azaleucine resistance transporter AzlC